MKTLILALVMGICAMGQVYSAATNFSVDIKGVPDSRPDTWGTAGYAVKVIKFTPPPHHRVRILRVYGDFLAWPIGKVEPGRFAGVLLGLQTTAPDGSERMDLGADNTMLYIQEATGGGPRRASFDYDTSVGGLLQEDGELIVKMAVWLNDTDLAIHMEPSFVMIYTYEKSDRNTTYQSSPKFNRALVSEHAPVREGESGVLLLSPRLKIRP